MQKTPAAEECNSNRHRISDCFRKSQEGVLAGVSEPRGESGCWPGTQGSRELTEIALPVSQFCDGK